MSICMQCHRDAPSHPRNRGLCDIHRRIQCMRDCAIARGKLVPSKDELLRMAEEVEASGHKCSHCKEQMVWRGEKGQRNVVSLQHDRSGTVRLLCMDCNFNHRYFPGDTYYDTPLGWKYCPKCSTAKPPEDFYRQGNGKLKSYCKACKHVIAMKEYSVIREASCKS